MNTLERAIEIAARAHAGDLDKAGAPYILHPLRLMLQMNSNATRVAAVLHDVVEDTPITLDDLRAEGFSPEILAAVDALTKLPGEKRIDAAGRAAANPIARAVKIADVTDNMDLSRINSPSVEDHERIREYERVLTYLKSQS